MRHICTQTRTKLNAWLKHALIKSSTSKDSAKTAPLRIKLSKTCTAASVPITSLSISVAVLNPTVILIAKLKQLKEIARIAKLILTQMTPKQDVWQRQTIANQSIYSSSWIHKDIAKLVLKTHKEETGTSITVAAKIITL